MYFRNERPSKSWLDHSLKSPVSEHRSTVNMLKGPKHFWNRHESTFIIIATALTRTDLGKAPLIQVWNHKSVCNHTWSADYKYPVLDCEYLAFPIEIQLYEKQKIFASFFIPIMEYLSDFKPFHKKGDRHSKCLSEINDCLRVG